MANQVRKRGAALFRVFLAASRQAQADAARAVDVSPVTVHHWLHERIVPRAERRAMLEQWSGGALPATAWDEPAAAWELAMADAAKLREDPTELLSSDVPERGAA